MQFTVHLPANRNGRKDRSVSGQDGGEGHGSFHATFSNEDWRLLRAGHDIFGRLTSRFDLRMLDHGLMDAVMILVLGDGRRKVHRGTGLYCLPVASELGRTTQPAA